MSAIRSALQEIAGEPDEKLSVDELAADIQELAHVRQQTEVLLARKTRSLADRFGHQDLGYSSPTNFLVVQGGMSPGEARRFVSYGNARDRAPNAYQSWADGRISTGQARHLFSAAEGVPDEYPAAEQRLVDIVEGLDVVDTGKAVEYWRQSVEGPGKLEPDQQQIRRGLSVSATACGMHRIDGWLTATAGTALQAALDALTPPRRDGDTRTPRQRRHDALEDLTRDWLDNGTTPTVGGEKPHLVVHTDLAALQGHAGGLHEIENGPIIDVNTLRLLACDCSITRIVLGSEGEALDVGRKTRVWTSAQRRAIIARDDHCQGKGCRRKAKYCDIHHREHWADGGTTTVDKAVLLCRPCHTLEHTKDIFQRRRSRT